MMYEAMFILDELQAKREWDETRDQVLGILKGNGCEILKEEKWGDRKFAYEINHQKRGTYFLVHFESDGKGMTKINREAELSDLITRVLILKRPRWKTVSDITTGTEKKSAETSDKPSGEKPEEESGKKEKEAAGAGKE